MVEDVILKYHVTCLCTCQFSISSNVPSASSLCLMLHAGDSNLTPRTRPVRMQRAVLYESMEKYKLGVEDLREVLRLDPGNREAATEQCSTGCQKWCEGRMSKCSTKVRD